MIKSESHKSTIKNSGTSQLRQLNRELKLQFQRSQVPEQEIIRRNGFEFHPSFDYSMYTDNELVLIHSVCHNLYSVRKSTRQKLQKIHQKIRTELVKRGMPHLPFDLLDSKSE